VGREEKNHYDGLIDLIASFLYKITSHSSSGNDNEINWRINEKSIGEIVNLKNIVPRIRKISSSSYFKELDERKRIAIKTFLDTVDGKIKDRF